MPSNSNFSQIARAVRDAAASLENANDVYTAVDNADDLPKAFHEVAKALAPAQQALKAIKLHLSKKKPTPEEDIDQIVEEKENETAEKLQTRALRLYDIFDSVIPPGDGPRTSRYRTAAGKGGRIEVLMKEILEAIIAITNPAILGEEVAAALEEALKKVSSIPPSLEDDPTHSFHNYGSGPQSIHLGHGDQNINTGSGMQFNGRFMAPFNLPKP